MAIENAFKRIPPTAKGLREDGDQRLAPDELTQNHVSPNPRVWADAALEIDHFKSVHARRIAFLQRLAVFIGLPTLATVAYVYLYASPRYVSEFQITYQSFDQPATAGGQASLISAMFGLG